MQYRLFRVALATAACFAPAQLFAQTAPADENRGFYLSVNAGVSKVQDVDVGYFDEGGTFGGTGTTDTAEFEVGLKDAFTFGGALGYDFGMVRGDVEFNYSRNKVESLELNSVNGSSVTITPEDREEICDYLEADSCGGSGNRFEFDGSRLRQLSALANVWFDIPTGSAVTPYVGGGVGIAGYELDGEGKARFAWQVGAGVSFDVSPNISLTADFRHRQVRGTTIDDGEDAGVTIGKVRSNILTAGLRFRF